MHKHGNTITLAMYVHKTIACHKIARGIAIVHVKTWYLSDAMPLYSSKKCMVIPWYFISDAMHLCITFHFTIIV